MIEIIYSNWFLTLSHIGVFYLSSPKGAARPFHQLALPCVILLTDGPRKGRDLEQ